MAKIGLKALRHSYMAHPSADEDWALRQIGKRNLSLNRRAIAEAEAILRLGSRSARWVANDALRELRSEAVQARLKKKQIKKG